MGWRFVDMAARVFDPWQREAIEISSGRRQVQTSFNFELIREQLPTVTLFTDEG